MTAGRIELAGVRFRYGAPPHGGMAAGVGSYSDREFFLDAPEAFVDFVIEAMRPELADYGV